MNLKQIGKVPTSKFVGTGPSSYKKKIDRAAVSQRLRNTALRACPGLSCNSFTLPSFTWNVNGSLKICDDAVAG